MRLAGLLLVVMLALASCGGRDQPDDSGLHQDILSGDSGAEVTFNASVVTEPVDSGGHERFVVNDPAGDRIEVDHNTTLAQPVPAHVGAHLIIHGQLYIDPGPRYGVHCTHAATSSGCPNPGWIEYEGTYYE